MEQMEWLLLASVAQAHLTLLLSKATIFDRPRKWISAQHPLLAELLSCPMCKGWWLAFPFVGLHPIRWLFVAGLGHLIYTAREKYLPCEACAAKAPTSFKVMNITSTSDV